jgi:chemotaxis protein histidine kinase CheA
VPADADDTFARQLAELRREYLADSPKRVAELRGLSVRLSHGDAAALADFRQAFHRLAGSGGSYGFPLVSTTSREAEHLVQGLAAAGGALTAADLAAIDACVAGIAKAFEEAARSFGSP